MKCLHNKNTGIMESWDDGILGKNKNPKFNSK
jgi:hypothetical protein